MLNLAENRSIITKGADKGSMLLFRTTEII